MQTVAPRYVSGESRTRTSTPKGCTRRRGKRTVLRGGYRRGARPLPTRTRPQPAAGVTARVVEASAPEQASYTSEERLQALESAVSSGTRVACPPGPRPAKRMATPSQVRGGDDQQTGLPPRHKGQPLGRAPGQRAQQVPDHSRANESNEPHLVTIYTGQRRVASVPPADEESAGTNAHDARAQRLARAHGG
jgi:hypothetical protein